MKFLSLTLAILLNLTFSVSQTRESAFNNQSIDLDSSGNYSFIVSGHFHGSGTNQTGYPTQTILASLDWINTSESNFLVCLGDLFLDVSNDIPFYKTSFFSKLELPLYNTVGNHDLTDDIYQKNYGDTYFLIEIGGDVHLFLDTELSDGSIKDEQLNLLKSVQEKVLNHSVKNVFIYSHRTIWAKHYNDLDRLFKDNTQATLGNNFSDEVQPLLKEISNKANVYWFSGSLGNAPASFFNFKDEHGVTYIATAIRGLKRDALLTVRVIDGKPTFETKSLTGEELMPFESYNIEFWNDKIGEKPFNYRLIPYYIKSMFLHRYFWYGIMSTIGLGLVLAFFRKRRRSKKKNSEE